MSYAFDAYVTAVSFDAANRAVFALGDGAVRFESGERTDAHDGAVLSATAHPSGEGLVTGGDDGRLVWSRASGPQEIASLHPLLPDVPDRLIGSLAGIKYSTRNPANSILICEEWSGLRTLSPPVVDAARVRAPPPLRRGGAARACCDGSAG